MPIKDGEPVDVERPATHSVEDLAGWALGRMVGEYKRLKVFAKVTSYARQREIENATRKLGTRPELALGIFRAETEILAHQVALKNIVEGFRTGRTNSMEGTPIQRRAELYFGLKKLLEHKVWRRGEGKHGSRLRVSFSTNDRLEEGLLTREPRTEKMDDGELLEYLYGLKEEIERASS